jgi:hypothetical protein
MCEDVRGGKSALARLRQVLREERVRESVQIIEVDDQEEAVRRRFVGSPTIRINDYDIEPEAASRSDFGLGCRTYPRARDALRCALEEDDSQSAAHPKAQMIAILTPFPTT